jgi:hypothetical protein
MVSRIVMPTDTMPTDVPQSWKSAWPDLIAFVLGLAVARASGWTTTDLVWSLWLSSLVVGYAMIVWSIVQPTIEFGGFAWSDHTAGEQSLEQGSWKALVSAMAFFLVGGLFVLAFFTIHFGGFHYIHSQFLIGFFPLDGQGQSATLATYIEVCRRYWWVLPSAFIAERSAFLRRTFTRPLIPPDISVTAEAVAKRKVANARRSGSRMTAPYAKVMRMHMLIFAFAIVHAAGLENFAVYALVYAVYFFPWRLLSRVEESSPAPVTTVESTSA